MPRKRSDNTGLLFELPADTGKINSVSRPAGWKVRILRIEYDGYGGRFPSIHWVRQVKDGECEILEAESDATIYADHDAAASVAAAARRQFPSDIRKRQSYRLKLTADLYPHWRR